MPDLSIPPALSRRLKSRLVKAQSVPADTRRHSQPSLNPQSEIRNPQSLPPNLQSEIRNPKWFSRIHFRTSFFHFGASLTELGSSRIQYGTSLTEYGKSLTLSGTSLTQYGRARTLSGTSLTQYGKSLTQYGKSLTLSRRAGKDSGGAGTAQSTPRPECSRPLYKQAGELTLYSDAVTGVFRVLIRLESEFLRSPHATGDLCRYFAEYLPARDLYSRPVIGYTLD
jgi:hypothetical protein